MRVAVVGMGFAGLACARALRAAGADVVAVEAQSRVGGRVRNDPLGGLLIEAGGEWIDGDQPRVQALLRDLGVAPIPASSLPSALHYDGALLMDDDPWPDVAEEEARLDAEARLRARELADPAWEESAQAGLDHIPLRAFVETLVRTDRGRWLTNARLRSDEGEDLDRISTLGWLLGYRNYIAREEGAMSALRAPGGLAGLARRLYAGEIVTDRPIDAVAFAGNGPTGRVVLPDLGGFGRVVLAIPPPMIERIVLTEPLPVATRCAIEGIGMARAAKIVFRFAKPFWEERGLSGRVLSDGPLQQLWAGPDPASGVLTAYIVGEGSRRWAELDDPVRAGVYEIGQLFPEAPELFIEGTFVDWAGDPHSRGAFPYLPLGYVTEHLHALGKPVGRVHFAGDWCATWMGFVEGALESGERAAREVLDAESGSH